MTALSECAVPGCDTLFRIGGEEFAVLLSGGSLDDAHRVAQRLRELVAVTPLLEQGLTVSMTVSVGLAAAQDDGLHWEDVLRHADKAMYHAKRQGRNRVAVYGVDVGLKEVARPQAMAA